MVDARITSLLKEMKDFECLVLVKGENNKGGIGIVELGNDQKNLDNFEKIIPQAVTEALNHLK